MDYKARHCSIVNDADLRDATGPAGEHDFGHGENRYGRILFRNCPSLLRMAV